MKMVVKRQQKNTSTEILQTSQPSSDTTEAATYDKNAGKDVLVNVDANRFAITVPGDKFYCSLEQNDYTERAIQGMKAKLREKKS